MSNPANHSQAPHDADESGEVCENSLSDKDESSQCNEEIEQHPWARIVTPDGFASDDDEEEEQLQTQEPAHVDKAKQLPLTQISGSDRMKSQSPQLVQLDDLECIDRNNPFIGSFRHAPKATPPSAEEEKGTPQYVPMADPLPENGTTFEALDDEVHEAIPMQFVCPVFPCSVDAMTHGYADDGFTVMVRNIPNRYTRDEFVEELDKTGFQGTYDFVNLPIDAETKNNKGYAFVNFKDNMTSSLFTNMYTGRRMLLSNSEKRVMVLPAECQGFNANYVRYFGSVGESHVDEPSRPLFLRDPDSKALDAVASTRKKKSQASNSTKKPTVSGSRRPQGRVSLIDMAARDKAAAERWTGPPAWSYQWSPAAGYWNQSDAYMHSPLDEGQVENELCEDVKFCTSCGAKAQGTFKFCRACGKVMDL